MDFPSSMLTEIDTTPFKTLDDLAENITRRLKISHGVFPKYAPPRGTTVVDKTSSNAGHFETLVCNITYEYPDGFATSLDASGAVVSTSSSSSWGNLSGAQPWNLSQAELGFNVTQEDKPPGWWEAKPGLGAGEWGPGFLAMTGLALYTLALCTAVGNALVIHAIRTEKRLQTVSGEAYYYCCCSCLALWLCLYLFCCSVAVPV